MNFIKIIIFLAVISPFMAILSGCYNDAFLDAIHEEEDFIAPFDVVLSDDQSIRIVNFKVSDSGITQTMKDGDDAFYTDVPEIISLTVMDNVYGNDDIVVDNVTGLIWTKCTATTENTMDVNDGCTGALTADKMEWQKAVSTCEALNTKYDPDAIPDNGDETGYGGYEDWRLPRLPELLSILNYDVGLTIPQDPAVDINIFPNTRAALNEGYWTYTSKLFIDDFGNTADWGWIVFFNIYHPESRYVKFWGADVELPNITDFRIKVGYDEDTSTYVPELQFVRCVRGGNS